MESRNKIEGYKQALNDAGILFKDEYLAEEENTIEGGYVAAKRLLGMLRRPEAIFTASDLL